MRRISVGYLEIGKKERKAISDVLDSGRISEGAKTLEFEKLWADYIGTRYSVATSSGTAALITVLTAFKYLYKLEKRPKVITSPLTYISDANALVLSGFEPVFVDIDPVNFCVTAKNIKEHLAKAKDVSKYSMILPIDLMGYSVEIDKIKLIAKEYGLHVIEDAAEAHGTVYNGKRCGSSADAGIFSFYIAHNLSAGEFGAVTTNNHEIYHLCKRIKANGRFCKCRVCLRHKGICPGLKEYGGEGEDDFDPRFLHDIIGYNFKAMEFQPALAIVQLKRMKNIIKRRQENVRYLNKGLIELSDILKLPLYSEKVSYLAYPLVIRDPELISRKTLRKALEQEGVETRPLFGCIPTQQPAYKWLKNKYAGKLPNAEY
ncbi:MAG: DegT/DnrJ/EryC1/StrS family aminotransferase, partial [Candidatus Omnitrophica bacterium]|nr:DegT/DnrJ/EryC1/StrS family aminotransferase [Candidatus Omnitrophota bacterium]